MWHCKLENSWTKSFSPCLNSVDYRDQTLLFLPPVSGSAEYGIPLGIMQSQPCTWCCDCEEESLNPHWWLWQGSTTRRRWFAASKFSSFNLCCFVTLFLVKPNFAVTVLGGNACIICKYVYVHKFLGIWQYDPRRVQGFRFSNLLEHELSLLPVLERLSSLFCPFDGYFCWSNGVHALVVLLNAVTVCLLQRIFGLLHMFQLW